MDSHPPLHPHLAGSPGVLHLSVDTRPPHTPRAVRCVHVLVTSASVAGFSTFGRVATANGFTRPNRVRLRWARVFALVACSRLAPRPVSGDRSVSRPWLPADAGPKLHGERAIHMTDTSQSAREMSVTGTPKNRRTEDPKGTGRDSRNVPWKLRPQEQLADPTRRLAGTRAAGRRPSACLRPALERDPDPKKQTP